MRQSRLEMIGKVNKEWIVHGILMSLIFVIAMYRLSETGQLILYDDEYGYWASSSYFLGLDWSSLTSRIGYYSYGYGALLVPLRLAADFFQWGWKSLYHAAEIVNGCMLAGSYLIAVQLCKRYMKHLDGLYRDLVCFIIMVYSSNLVYAHIGWTECTLSFLFWVYLYLQMKVTDHPGMLNHMGMAFVSMYIYTVHQRALAITITGLFVVVYLYMQKKSRLKYVAAFLAVDCICLIIHRTIKTGLQNDFYMKKDPLGISGIAGEVFSEKSFVLILGIFLILLCLYLLQKGKCREMFVLGIVTALLVIWIIGRNGSTGTAELTGKLAINDFAGQLKVVKKLFSAKGIIRLLISMIGKWFYLASSTGLLICWGLKDLFKKGFSILAEDIRGIRNLGIRKLKEGEQVWLLGVFIAWVGVFLISSIYKEGLYKVDDLLNGRYTEIVLGVLLLYSINSFISDKKWMRTALISAGLYLLSGILCQYVLNELGRTEFELAHSVMLGRVIWNWEVPVGKMWKLMGYVLPLSILFLLINKIEISRLQKWKKVKNILALAIPMIVWVYLSFSIVDHYVVKRNQKQENTMPIVSMWIDALDSNNNIYYLEDSENYRWAENIQFMLRNKIVNLTTSTEAPYEEDAFFIMNTDYSRTAAVQKKCVTIVETSQFALLVSRDQELEGRFERYMEKNRRK